VCARARMRVHHSLMTIEKCYLAHVNPSQVNLLQKIQLISCNSKVVLFLPNSLLNIYCIIPNIRISTHTISKCQFNELKDENILMAVFARYKATSDNNIVSILECLEENLSVE
jgi:hypothetical protein